MMFRSKINVMQFLYKRITRKPAGIVRNVWSKRLHFARQYFRELPIHKSESRMPLERLIVKVRSTFF